MTVTATRWVRVNGRRAIAQDWYPAVVPENVQIDATAYVGSSYSFVRCRSEQPVCVEIGRGASLCDATSLDIGPHGIVRLGEYALVNGARIICDAAIEIGSYSLVSWDVVLMDTYRGAAVGAADVHPIRIGRNSWVGFGACVLPGVTIGDGSIVASRSVVAADVPAYVVVAGNPARVVRDLPKDDR
jgi:acetyltransferase-like isoleucine patch superfamily enzyme